jgi:hypothetical protein
MAGALEKILSREGDLLNLSEGKKSDKMIRWQEEDLVRDRHCDGKGSY